MDIDAAFPSLYLKSSDLQGRNIPVVIDRVEIEELGFGRDKDHKPVVYFQKSKKGLVLNKTNSNTIKAAYGRDTDGWIGKPLVLFPAMVDFAGDTVEAIRVRVPTQKQPAPPASAPVQQVENAQYTERNPPPHDDMDDEIPF